MNLKTLFAQIADLAWPHPARDWAIVLLTAVIVAAGATGMAGYRFWTIQVGSIVSASADVPRAPMPVSRDLIKKVIETYQQRAVNYTARNFLVFTLNDPYVAPKKK